MQHKVMYASKEEDSVDKGSFLEKRRVKAGILGNHEK